MTLQLEVGKYYRSRKGEKIFIESTDNHPAFPFDAKGGMSYTNIGREYQTYESDNDLIEEWKDEESIVAEVNNNYEHDPVNHPQHYGGDTPYETIKVMKARLTPEEFIGACKFNVYKYNDRAKQKGCELENYRKAQFYQNALVDFLSDKT